MDIITKEFLISELVYNINQELKSELTIKNFEKIEDLLRRLRSVIHDRNVHKCTDIEY